MAEEIKKDKKELIMESATKLIFEKGYSDTKVEDITKEAGIAKGTFYIYFKTKDDLIVSIIENSIKKYETILKKIDFTNKSFKETMKEFINSKIKFAKENQEIFIIVISFIFDSSNINFEIKNLLFEQSKKISKKIKNIIEKGIEKGGIDKKYEDKVNYLSNLINDLINFHIGKMFIENSYDSEVCSCEINSKILKKQEINLNTEEESEFILNFILNGIETKK